MISKNADPTTMLPLRPVVFEILLILNESERHGYGLMQDVKQRTGGRWVLGPGTLYRTIRELLDKGLIAPSNRRPAPDADDERRRYYGLTKYGQQVAAAEAARMESLVRVAQSGKLI